MSKQKTNLMIFSLGACGYGLIEILWRGYTHWSMLGAGGLSFLGLSSLATRLKRHSLLLKGIAGCGLITAIEYVFGVIFNLLLKKNVWDYSRMPLNLNGQICALYSFFWMMLSFVGVPIAGRLRNRLEKEDRTPYSHKNR